MSLSADGGPGPTALVVLLLVVVQGVETTVLQPWLQSRTVRMHPAVVLLTLTAGATLAGVTGTLIALPVAAVLSALRTSPHPTAVIPGDVGPPPAPEGTPRN